VRYLAPVDGEAGGTWVFVNEFGLAAFLLNRNGRAAAAGAPSRGAILRSLGAARSLEELAERLARRAIAGVAPFTVAALAHAETRALRAIWDGERLAFDELPEGPALLCSSSLDDTRADRDRRLLFAARRAMPGPWTSAAHRRFHTSHEPEPSPWSVCMHRADAETVSYCEIAIDDERVLLDYLPGPPCRGGRPHRAELARAARAIPA